MIYLKEFKIWDKIFGKKKSNVINTEEVVNRINLHLDIYCLKKDRPIFATGYHTFQYERLHEDDDITFNFTPHDNQLHIFYSDGRIKVDMSYKPTFEINDPLLYKRVKEIFFKQRNKWISYIYISLLIEEFSEYNSDVDMAGFGELNWNLMNDLNDDFSFFRYPNIIDELRLEDMLESDYKFDIHNKGVIFKLNKLKDTLKRLGIVIS